MTGATALCCTEVKAPPYFLFKVKSQPFPSHATFIIGSFSLWSIDSSTTLLSIGSVASGHILLFHNALLVFSLLMFLSTNCLKTVYPECSTWDQSWQHCLMQVKQERNVLLLLQLKCGEECLTRQLRSLLFPIFTWLFVQDSLACLPGFPYLPLRMGIGMYLTVTAPSFVRQILFSLYFSLSLSHTYTLNISSLQLTVSKSFALSVL